MTKEGETEFLRQQLKQVIMRSDNEKKEKTLLLEEQLQKHQNQMNEIRKEKDSLKTQMELKVFI